MKIQGLCGAPRPANPGYQTVFLQTNYGKTQKATIVKQGNKSKLIYGNNPDKFPEPHGIIITIPEFIKGIHLKLSREYPVSRNDFLQLDIPKSQMPVSLTAAAIIYPQNILQHIPAQKQKTKTISHTGDSKK